MDIIIKTLLFVCIVCTMMSCSSSTRAGKYVTKVLGANFSEGEVLSDVDDYGAWNGDGSRYIKIILDEDQAKSVITEIKNNDMWRELPMSDELNKIIHSSYMIVEAEFRELLTPTIENGYSYFSDRSPQSTDKKDYTNVLRDRSGNFRIAVFDAKNKTLFFYSFDM